MKTVHLILTPSNFGNAGFFQDLNLLIECFIYRAACLNYVVHMNTCFS